MTQDQRPRMSKKDFELIARVIRKQQLSDAQRAVLVSDFATELLAINPKFHVERFRAACVPTDQIEL